MMRRVVVAAACAAALAVQAQQAAPPSLATQERGQAAPGAAPSAATSAATIEAGRRAYTGTCARCHGIGLVTTSGAYFDLRTFPKDEKSRFVDAVVNGKRQMPAWGALLKPDAIESIWLYVANVNGW